MSRIGEGSSEVKFKSVDASAQYEGQEEIGDHAVAIGRIVALLEQHGQLRAGGLCVVGHRIVHGGQDFEAPAVIDAAAEAAIEKTIPLAPLHNPAGLLGIRVAKAKLAGVPHVAVFDTAFHATMPPVSYRYALPKALYEVNGIRRYGFHGTSYGYVSSEVGKVLGKPAPDLIVFHLGNGASAACVKNGKCLDTTMGLTPLEGLMMGTRCGDVDAGVFAFMCRQLGKTADEVDNVLNKQSGLLGTSGVSLDMREVTRAADEGNADARLARDMYVERIRKYLGAYLVKLDGACDAIVFTAGVGENDADLRDRVCRNLSSLGLEIDEARNTAPSAVDGPRLVSMDTSRIKIYVTSTNEEKAIAIQATEAAGVDFDNNGRTP